MSRTPTLSSSASIERGGGRGRPVRMVWASTLRRWWRSWVVLAGLVAAVGGFCLTTTAAGRRTAAAYPSFVTRYGFDVAAFAAVPIPALTRLPNVTSALLSPNPQAGRPSCPCRPTIPAADFTVLVEPSRGALPLKLLSGRLPDRTRPEEAVVSESMRALGVRIGSEVTVPFYGASQLAALGGNSPPPAPTGPMVRFHVVGIEVSEGEFPAGSTPSYNLYAGSAFSGRYGASTANAYLYSIKLRGGGGSLAGFERDANNLAGQGFEGYLSPDLENEAVERAIHPQAMGWWALALLSAVAGLAMLAQALARQSGAESGDYPVLAAVGFTRSQLFRLETLRNAAVGLVGAAGAVAIAYVFSPLTPVGEARLAEPATGFHFDVAVLIPGGMIVAAATLLAGLLPTLFSTRHPSRIGETAPIGASTVVERMSTLGLPPSATVGVRNALVAGRGRSSVPVRTALLGTVLAVAALCGTAVYNTSLGHLTSTPSLYGDLYQLNFNEGGAPDQLLVNRLRADRQVTAVNEGFPAELRIGRDVLGGAAVRSLRGPILMPIISGRMVNAADEVDLGAVTLRQTGAHVGSTIRVTFARPQGGSATVPMRVVGVVVLPILGNTVDLGTGALITQNAFVSAVCSPPAPVDCPQQLGANTDGGILAAFKTTRAGQAELARYRADYPSVATTPVAPTSLLNFGQAVSFPLIFGLLVALFGVATLLHMLVTSVARRRHEAGLLKALGFLDRQVAASVGWQSTTTALVGLLVGVPLGIAAGRLVWSAFAGDFGVVNVTLVPTTQLLILAVGVLAVAAALAVPAALVAAGQTASQLLADS